MGWLWEGAGCGWGRPELGGRGVSLGTREPGVPHPQTHRPGCVPTGPSRGSLYFEDVGTAGGLDAASPGLTRISYRVAGPALPSRGTSV